MPTSGPNEDFDKATIIGEAAHIKGKKPGSPRYDESMTDESRADIRNGLWACGNCHKEFDTNYKAFSIDQLVESRQRAEACAKERMGRDSGPPIAPLLERIPQQWCHETTNDATYVRRPTVVGYLDAWCCDSSVRTISLTGIGGVGKTSLVGHWLKSDYRRLVRDVRGVFYWSFYVEKNVDVFLGALIHFIEGLDTDVEFRSNYNDALTELDRVFPKLPPLILVLDGLEVLQHALSEGAEYGAFIDATLRDFIQLIAYAKAPWLCIITSRFPITDLRARPQARQLPLIRLEPGEGADVLYQNQVLGSVEDRRRISVYLNGHALALRIFSASLPRSLRITPLQHLSEVFAGLNEENDFLQKLLRLLQFYSTTLSTIQYAVLRSLSLFRSPVLQRAVQTLVPTILDGVSAGTDGLSARITSELNRLVLTGLIVRDGGLRAPVFACHPIVRDFFRRSLLGQRGAGGAAAINLLVSRPDDLGLEGATNLEPILLACEALLISGSIGEAVELYDTRLSRGHALLQRGLPKEAKRIYDAFVRYVPADWRPYYTHLAGIDRIYFRTAAILFDVLLGEYVDARHAIATQLNEAQGARRASTYNHRALLEYSEGQFAAAADTAKLTVRATMQEKATGSRALIHANAHYTRLKALVSMGQSKEAHASYKALSSLQEHFDTDDGRILVLLGDLWLRFIKPRDGGGETAKLVRAMIGTLNEDHLVLDAQATLAHWYIHEIRRDRQRHASKLLGDIYPRAVAQSYPYFMIQAQILRQYLAYRTHGSLSLNELEQAATLAEVSGMRGLQAQALYVHSLFEPVSEAGRRVEAIALDLSFCGLASLFPDSRQ